MNNVLSRVAMAVCLSLLLTAVPTLAEVGGAGKGYPIRYLTEERAGEPLEIAMDYLRTRYAQMGLSAADLEGVVVKDLYRTRHNGVTHIYLRQTLGGIEVLNGDININVNERGRILNVGSLAVPNLAEVVRSLDPRLTAREAIVKAAQHLAVDLPERLERLAEKHGVARESLFRAAGLSLDDVPVKLMIWSDGRGGARLGWEMVLRLPDQRNWWQLIVDAETGRVLDKGNWIADAGCTECYNVFALPKESPIDGPRTTEIMPADPVASPFGWHDDDGVPGAEFTDTRGNNTEAQTDLDANNNPAGEIRGEGGANLDFDPPLDLNDPPSEYREFAVVNLFYWNNIMHDVLYRYGFDEPAGNFQQNNYGNGGAAGDPVQADAQDGSGFNNANFSTPADGSDGRMQMFIWLNPFPNALEVIQPVNIADVYVASSANFGPPFDQTGFTSEIKLADDGVGPDVNDGCEPLINGNELNGKIALINRGTCTFVTKVRHAQDVGATSVAIVKITPGNPITLGDDGTGGDITIPSGMITMEAGDIIKGELGGNVGANYREADPAELEPDRDSDLDNGIIAHEYGHGLSNRLTGGPSNVFCLNNSEQAGEGWSDLMTLMLTAVETDTGEMSRGIGNYAIFEADDGPGIRNFPYSTDLAINPQTYVDVGFTNVPHGVGEIWAAMVWDMYWALVDEYGFDSDLYTGTGGNNIAMQLLVDGMKLQNCSPTFVDARDAILLADFEATGGVNQCLIWEAFAKRGLGLSADAGGTGVGDETEAFDIPVQCENTGVELSLSGSCPGDITMSFTGGTPNGTARMYWSDSLGTTVLQGGPCAGETIDLDNPRLLAIGPLDGNGEFSKTRTAGANQCGNFVQVFDESSCLKSDPEQLP